MKRLILLLLTIYLRTSAQSIDIYIKYYDKKDAQKKFRKEVHVKDTMVSNNPGDTLIGFFKNNVQSGFIKLNFLKSDDEFAQKYCIRQEVILDCHPCSTKFLEGLLHAKGYNWRKISENNYATDYFFQTHLTVIYNDEEKYCMRLIFEYIDKPKTEYKSWYQVLTKL